MSGLKAWAVCGVVAAGSIASLAAGKGDPKKGEEVFAQCAICHNADSDVKKNGPGLKGLFKKGKLNSGKTANESNIRSRIDEGGQGMPAYKDMLSDQEKDDLIAYLKTL
jgi:mono/diheme cytochrome c family protein